MYTLQDIHQKKHTLSNFCLATHVLHNESTYYTLPIKFKSLQFADLFSLVCLHKRTTRIYLGGRVLTKLYNQVPSLYKQFWLCFNARIAVLSPIICLNFWTILFKIQNGNVFCNKCVYRTLTSVHDKSGVLVFKRNFSFALLQYANYCIESYHLFGKFCLKSKMGTYFVTCVSIGLWQVCTINPGF